MSAKKVIKKNNEKGNSCVHCTSEQTQRMGRNSYFGTSDPVQFTVGWKKRYIY